MYFFLILFFGALAGITTMIVRRLIILKQDNNYFLAQENFLDFLDLEKIKKIILKKMKEGIHILTFITLRAYLISLNFIKKKKKEIASSIQQKIIKYLEHYKKESDEKEPSKYLKMISEYRHKIKRLKHRIKEEEGIE